MERTGSNNRVLWVGVVLTLALMLAAGAAAFLDYRAGRAAPALPVYGQVADFTLTNQLGQTITLASLRGQPWVADIVFTRCAGPCPAMTRQMREIQKQLPPASRARLITLTTDPEFDTVAVLKNYAERFEADGRNWWFLTGSQREIANLAIDSLKLTTVEKKPEERQDPADLFVHSTLLVLVDGRGRLRGIYATTGLDGRPAPATREVLRDLERLEREP